MFQAEMYLIYCLELVLCRKMQVLSGTSYFLPTGGWVVNGTRCSLVIGIDEKYEFPESFTFTLV